VREDLYQLEVLKRLDKQTELLAEIKAALLNPPAVVVGVDLAKQATDLQAIGIGTDGPLKGTSISGKARKR
jgi:hypothetical protein